MSRLELSDTVSTRVARCAACVIDHLAYEPWLDGLHDGVRGLVRELVARHHRCAHADRLHVLLLLGRGQDRRLAVLPALVPDLGYDDLEIAEGETASRQLMQLVTGEPALPPAECAGHREALLRYCERDTLAMVRVLSRLRELARPG